MGTPGVNTGPKGTARKLARTSGAVAATFWSLERFSWGAGDPMALSTEVVRPVLAKLRVKPGLRWTGTHPIAGPWGISFEYDREQRQFFCTLSRDARSSTMYLQASDVETRGKSLWLTDNTWRLSPVGLDKVESSILAVAAKEPGHGA